MANTSAKPSAIGAMSREQLDACVIMMITHRCRLLRSLEYDRKIYSQLFRKCIIYK